jgi:hypothetical protein
MMGGRPQLGQHRRRYVDLDEHEAIGDCFDDAPFPNAHGESAKTTVGNGRRIGDGGGRKAVAQFRTTRNIAMVRRVLLSNDGTADGSQLVSARDAFDAAIFGLRSMSEAASAELAWDFTEGKGERELCARIAHQLRALGVPVRRESSDRVDLVIDQRFKLEFKVAYLASIFGSDHERSTWGLGVFDKGLGSERGDLFKLVNERVDLIVLCVPWLRDSPHAKYAKKLGVGPSELDDIDDRFSALMEECRTWATSHSIRICKRDQIELCDPTVGRVELTFVGFERDSDDS